MHSLPFRVCAIAAAPVCGKDWYSILLDTALKRIARCPFFCIAGGRWHCAGRLELFQVAPENEESFLQLSKASRILSKTATHGLAFANAILLYLGRLTLLHPS